MKFFLLCLSLLFTQSSFAEGFGAGTLVQTPEGLTPIESLAVGDEILSCSFGTPVCVEKKIVATASHKSTSAIEIQIADEFIVTEDDQTFFSQEENIWVPASDFFISNVEHEVDLYSLSIEDTHNYYITPSSIIAHNFAMALVATAIPVIGPVVGGGILLTTLGAAIVSHIDDAKREKKEREEREWREAESRKQQERRDREAAENRRQQEQRDREVREQRQREDLKKKELQNKNAEDFEKDISKFKDAGERVAKVREMADAKAQKYGWSEVNASIKKKNPKRTIYQDKNGDYWSVDTQHGTFEKLNSKGKHQGEFSMDLKPKTNKGPDKTGQHDINI